MSQKSRVVCRHHLQGQCHFGSRCYNFHGDDSHWHGGSNAPQQTGGGLGSYEDYVPIPADLPVGLVLGTGGKDIRRLTAALKRSDKMARLVLQLSDRERREIKVIAVDRAHFLETKARLEHHFAALLSTQHKKWTFFMLNEVAVHNDAQFKFCKYRGHMLHHFSPQVCEAGYVLHVNDEKNQNGTTSTSAELHGSPCGMDGEVQSPEPKFEEFCVATDYNRVIKQLQECLELIRQEMRDTQEEKLEARFGRMIWHSLPADYVSGGITLKELEEFTNTNSNYRKSLNTSVEIAGTCNLQEEMKGMSTASRTVDTYHLRTTFCDDSDPGKPKKLDVRIMLMDDGTAKILGINKDTHKKAVFNILCVHKQHDFRLELGLQETVCKDNSHFVIIQEMVKMISTAVPGELTLVPYTNKWTVHFIRHKRRTSYILGPEDTHMVTVSQITELEVKHGTCQAGDLLNISLNGNENIHWEVELCNLHWEPEFQKEAGMSTQEALCRYLEHPFAEGTAVQRSLQSGAIGQKDLEDMFETLDMINYFLEQ